MRKITRNDDQFWNEDHKNRFDGAQNSLLLSKILLTKNAVNFHRTLA